MGFQGWYLIFRQNPCSTYAGIKQRWLVVESLARREADLKHLDQKRQQHLEKAQKQLQHLGQQDFACVPDALAAAEQWNKRLRYHRLSQIEVVPHPYYRKAGRPRKGQAPDGYRYRLQGTLTLFEEVVALALKKSRTLCSGYQCPRVEVPNRRRNAL